MADPIEVVSEFCDAWAKGDLDDVRTVEHDDQVGHTHRGETV